MSTSTHPGNPDNFLKNQLAAKGPAENDHTPDFAEFLPIPTWS